MNEKRSWTEQEDHILKKLVEDTKFTKWTHIARIMSEDYGIKGRNGKQCKERYLQDYVAILNISIPNIYRRNGCTRISLE